MSKLTKLVRDRAAGDERGAALVEFAIAVIILITLLALVLDTGLGYTAARSSASTARAAARVGALAGETRFADFAILDAINAQYADDPDQVVTRVIVYRSDPGGTGEVPISCSGPGATSQDGLCNVYNPSDLSANDKVLYDEQPVDPGDPDGDQTCTSGSPDEAWCPLDRRANDGSYLGVAVNVEAKTTIGLAQKQDYEFQDRAVFSLYFKPEALLATPTP